MQNEPNLQKSQMNVTSLITVAYENIANCKLCENEPNTNPIKPKTNPILSAVGGLQMNITSFYTVDYKNIANCKLCENKANTKPIQTQYKPNTNPICWILK